MIAGLRWWLVLLLFAIGLAIGHFVVPYHDDRPSFVTTKR